ncbi:hypothetical protein [Pedobacter duraquae]|nr:hypothetical protein [Pedobacter duraquae]
MARTILTRGRSHADMKELSRHASEFNDKLLRIENKDQDYLALLFILAQHLNEINLGSCACSIVEKPMYNSPERLEGILEILSETFNEKEYAVCIHSRCLACGKEYESKMVDSGFGQKVIWKEKVQRS